MQDKYLSMAHICLLARTATSLAFPYGRSTGPDLMTQWYVAFAIKLPVFQTPLNLPRLFCISSLALLRWAFL